MKQTKSWRDRLAGFPTLPNVKAIAEAMRARRGEGTIAARHRATIGCTVTTAIFAHMVAHDAEEARAAGGKSVTPWWRTLKIGGEPNGKYPGGIEAQMARLETEGHAVVQRGKPYFVEDFEKKLV